MSATIRLATEADADDIASIYAPFVEDTAVSFETEPPETAEVAGRIRDTTDSLPWLVCEHDDAVVGYAYATLHNERPAYRWSVDVSVYVYERWQQRGVASGLYESLFEILRRQGLYNAYAVIVLPNPPSVAFHESVGFSRVGVYRSVGYKHGEWRDVGHWQLSVRSPSESPPEPTPVEDVRETSDWRDAIAAGEAEITL